MTKTNKQKNSVVKIPLRKDLVSREMFDKREMLRIVKDKENNVQIDKTGKSNGRGTYVQVDTQSAETLKQKKLLDKEFGIKVPVEIYDQVIETVNYQLARRELLENQTIVKKQNP